MGAPPPPASDAGGVGPGEPRRDREPRAGERERRAAGDGWRTTSARVTAPGGPERAAGEPERSAGGPARADGDPEPPEVAVEELGELERLGDGTYPGGSSKRSCVMLSGKMFIFSHRLSRSRKIPISCSPFLASSLSQCSGEPRGRNFAHCAEGPPGQKLWGCDQRQRSTGSKSREGVQLATLTRSAQYKKMCHVESLLMAAKIVADSFLQ